MTSVLRRQRNEERKQCTRLELLDAAAKVFIKRGYHNTLISEIVAEAGVGQGTFYRNFADKREILETLLEGFISKMLDEFTDMSTNLPTNVEEYRGASIMALKRVAEIVDQNRELSLFFLREGPSIDKTFAESIETVYERFAGLARFYLDYAIENGFSRPCRSDLIAESIVGIALRLIERWWSDRLPDTSLEEMITEVVDFAFWGFGLPPKGKSA